MLAINVNIISIFTFFNELSKKNMQVFNNLVLIGNFSFLSISATFFVSLIFQMFVYFNYSECICNLEDCNYPA